MADYLKTEFDRFLHLSRWTRTDWISAWIGFAFGVIGNFIIDWIW